MKQLKKKWHKINYKILLNTSKFLITISSILIFLAWLMFIYNNFYPKSPNSFTSKLMRIPVEIMIWPAVLIALFVLILPIWVTTNNNLLFIFLIISLIISLLNFAMLFALNINSFWIYWLITDIISFFSLLFTLFIIMQKNKNNN